jgi:membrane-bound serine protease (ClpP class)
MIWIVSLILAGFVLILAEIFLPGLIAGILGCMFLLGALFAAGTHYGTQGVLWTLGVELLLGFVFFVLWMKYFPKSRWGRAFSLPETEIQRSSKVDTSGLLGKNGLSLTPLRPSGVVQIDGRRHDALTEGLHVAQGTEVTVVKINGAVIVVRPVITQ